MKKILQKLAIAGVGSVLIAGSTFAQTIANDDTGRNSHNEVKVERENEVDADVHNDADIFNHLFVDANTGDNEVKDNGGGDRGDNWDRHDDNENGNNGGEVRLETGDAEAMASVTNRANMATVSVGAPENSSIDAMNSDTGRNSHNEIRFEESNKVDVDIQNDADITNCINVSANTGYNSVKDNSGDVRVATGNATATVDVTNEVNTATVSVGK